MRYILAFFCLTSAAIAGERFDQAIAVLAGEWIGSGRYEVVGQPPVTVGERDVCRFVSGGSVVRVDVEEHIGEQKLISHWIYSDLKSDRSFQAKFTEASGVTHQFAGQISPDGTRIVFSAYEESTKMKHEIAIRILGSLLTLESRAIDGEGKLVVKGEAEYRKSEKEG